MNKLSEVWVFSDAASRYPELIAAGLNLGDKVNAIVLGDPDDAANAFVFGASEVYYLGEKPDRRIVEDYDATIADALNRSPNKPTLLLLDSGKRNKMLAAKISGLTDAGLVNDVAEITYESGAIKTKRIVYGGLALAEEKIVSPIAVATLTSGVFAAQPADAAKTGRPQTLPFIEPKAAVRCVGRRAREGNRVDLNKAARVVGIGRGVASQDDIQMMERLCHALEAELGCSRPIAEGEKWMDRDRYIGVSGVMIKPDLYLALGISGQIQHMVGVSGAQTIIAVNKDKNAPIFQLCDYGLVGDIYKVVPALINKLAG